MVTYGPSRIGIRVVNVKFFVLNIFSTILVPKVNAVSDGIWP